MRLDVFEYPRLVHVDDIIVFVFDSVADTFVQIRVVIPGDISRAIYDSLDDVLVGKERISEEQKSSVNQSKYDENNPYNFYRKKTKSDLFAFFV